MSTFVTFVIFGASVLVVCPIVIALHGTDYKITCICLSVVTPTLAVLNRF